MTGQAGRQGAEIALVGMSFRFPGASRPEAFWENLRDGVEAIRFFSDEELLAAGVEADLLRDPRYVKARGVLDDVELFDAEAFGFRPREAQLADPQQRLFLECSWEALENAGYSPESYGGTIGVFGGVSFSSYLFNLGNVRSLAAALSVPQLEVGNDKDHLATRVAYKLNLKGPALTIQTGCSTSLTALHVAMQSLLNFECDMALAGGASITVPQTRGYLYQDGGINSPDGHCRAFDARAQGIVSGNGVGVVLVKRLEDALADGDEILAVVKSSAVNNDGADKSAYTAPSVAGQARVVREALALAGLRPGDVSYVEAHGTGTALGDVVEIAALKRAFGSAEGRRAWCGVGSVKTGIGHLNAAAGVAGLIKVVLMLGKRQMPPSLHCENPNPQLELDGSPFYVNAALRDWDGGGVLRCGLSSFTLGGTNVHLILEEPPPRPPSARISPAAQLLVLSAATPEALERSSANLADELGRRGDVSLPDVAYTLQVGRRPLRYRRALVAGSPQEAVQVLAEARAAGAATSERRPAAPPVIFLFPGQGERVVETGRALYEDHEVFRREIDLGCELLEPRLGLDLRQVLYPEASRADEAARRRARTDVAQPALFVFELALAKLWMSLGIRPEAMLGHSLGELAAACLAGVFRTEEALLLVAERGRLVQELPEGAMLAVALPETELSERLPADLDLAAVNHPNACVVAGHPSAAARFEASLREQGIGCRRVPVERAFHSRMIDPVLDPLLERLSAMTLEPPKVPFLSSLSGTWTTDQEATDPAYWARQMRGTVRFSAGLQEVLRSPERVLLEVGGGSTLTRLARRHPECSARRAVSSLSGAGAHPGLVLEALARLWGQGVEVDWTALHAGQGRRRLPLPTYPFERRRHWLDPADAGDLAGAESRFGEDPPAPVRETPRLDADSTQLRIAALIGELGGFERVGLEDNFFELGGDSLLAVQVVSRLRQIFQVDLAMSSLFEEPTVQGLARQISAAQLAAAGPSEDFDALLAQIEALSPEEVKAALAEAIPPAPAPRQAPAEDGDAPAQRRLGFSLFFFSDDGSKTGPGKYRLLFESARFADRHGFEAVWTPERHFQDFGGLYPNPSLLSAALVTLTRRVEIRAGSLVLPLHNPVRVAEDWSVLDNLSEGRVGMSVASGWSASDFTLSPSSYPDRRRIMFEGIELLRRLWSGESLRLPGGDGATVEVALLPRPLSAELPIWVTTSGSLETWLRAAEIGANVLTGLHEDLAQRIALYRRTRREHGHPPGTGRVTVMLHTFLGEDLEAVKEKVRAPMIHYLRTFAAHSHDLRPGRPKPTAQELDDLAAFGFEERFQAGSLLGTPESCLPIIRRLKRDGVDEVACLIDFGLDHEEVLAGLERLDELRRSEATAEASR